ncbi:MAG: ABC transporter permease [Candidatus Dormiibacterota bacterium]
MTAHLAAIWAILRKDLSLSLRRPTVIVVTILPALILLLVLVLQAAAVTSEPVAIVNADPGCGAARSLQRTATAFDGFRTTVESPAAAQQDFRNLQVAAVLSIPSGFCSSLAAGERPALDWQVRNFNADTTNDLERGVGDVVSRFLASGAAGPNPIHITIDEHDLHAQDAGFVGFQLVAVLVLLLLQAGLINAGLAAAMEWQTRSVKELLLAPVSSLVLVLGKVLAGVVAADVAGTLLAGAAIAAQQLPVPSVADALGALAVMTVLGVFGSALGVAVGAGLRSIERVNPVATVLSFYLFFLAGGIAAAAYFPDWLRIVARLVPNFYGIDALRNTLLYGTTSGLGLDLLVLVLASLVMLAIGVPAMRRGLAH